MQDEYKLKSLGESAQNNKDKYSQKGPDKTLLEHFPSPHEDDDDFTVTAHVSEFTSLCPVTGQPDYGSITIEYKPDAKCVESKSLKLYLMGYRNYGAFCETVAKKVLDDLVAVLEPSRMRVTCYFNSRGGIDFTSVAEYPRTPF